MVKEPRHTERHPQQFAVQIRADEWQAARDLETVMPTPPLVCSQNGR